MTIHGASTGFAQILVNDLDALRRPAQTDGPIDEAVLQLRALLVLAHLSSRMNAARRHRPTSLGAQS